MWIWIFAFIGLLVIWGGSALLGLFGVGIAVLWRVLLTLALILLVVAVVLFRRWRSGAAARALEREILKQSEQQLMHARPDRRAEILELRGQIERGIQSLKASKVGGKTGRRALYALPWYVIIGPPGAGKTTALKKSGLTFAFTDASGGAVRGVGGTRNCDWWFSNDAILLDTAGRYATEEQDRGEWIAFLDMLRRFRSSRPINGVIVAISVSELMDQSEDVIAELAKKLRARVDEIMSRLQMVVPVYVMFTKTDLIDGFVEYWGELRKSERDQVFGATYPLEAITKFDPGKAFEKEFSRLVDVIHAHSVRRVGKERTPEARRKILDFPLEFHVLRKPLAYFIGLLFMRNRFQGTPLFRGFYFTSGTQEGSPVSRVVAGMVRAFGLQNAMPNAMQQSREAKSYFVTDVFRRVIFPDQSIAARTESEARRQTLLRVAFALGCLFLGLSMVVPATVTFVRNKSLISSVTKVTKATRKLSWNDDQEIAAKAEQLDGLKAQLEKLESWEKEGPPLGMTWGMYSGSTLLPVVRRAYAEELHEALALPARPELETQLRSFTEASSDTTTYGRQYAQLKLYLMLGQPQRLEIDWAAPILTRAWAKALRSRSPQADETALAPHARYYLELLKRGEARAWDQDARLVASARTTLRKAPSIERTYGILIRDADADVAPIRQEDIFYGSAAQFFTSKKGVKISGAYTKAGYRIVKKLFKQREELLSAESWVLEEPVADKNSSEAEELIAKLQDMYFERFQESWKAFFLDIQVKQPATYDECLSELQALSEPEWPYLRLIRTLAENVRLDVGQGELSSIAKKEMERRRKALFARAKVKPTPSGINDRFVTPMEEAFQPLLEFGAPPIKGSNNGKPPAQMSQYIDSLSKVVGVITDARDSSYGKNAATHLDDEMDAAVRGSKMLLDKQSVYTRAILEPLLLRPLDVQNKSLKPAHK